MREDYDRILSFGMSTARIAARWHRIEFAPGKYDFRSLTSYLDAADEKGIALSLDILHFGWPDFIDPFSPDFPQHFAEFTAALVHLLNKRERRPVFIAPVNEISYVSWAGGEVGCIGPFTRNRGHELKRNLVRAAVAGCRVLLNDLPGVRLMAPEPVIHIIGDPNIPGDEEEARAYTNAMFESWDMICGRMSPELGGRPEYLDLIGVNFYERNQWLHNGGPITREHPRWRPFHDILKEVWNRYRRPLFVAETGTEGDARASWFHYVSDEVRQAIREGVPVHGICLYPILNHPGWDDDRHCCNGLFDYAGASGQRAVYEPLAEAIQIEQKRFAEFFRGTHERTITVGSDLPFTPEVGFRFATPTTPDEPVCT